MTSIELPERGSQESVDDGSQPPPSYKSVDSLGHDNKAFQDSTDSIAKPQGKELKRPVEDVPVNTGTDDEEDEDFEPNSCEKAVSSVQFGLQNFLIANKRVLKILLIVVLVMLYGAYFSYAMYYKFGDEGSIRLLVITGLIVLGIIYSLVKTNFGDKLYKCLGVPVIKFVKRYWRVFKWLGLILFITGLILVLVFEVVMKSGAQNLVSGVGIIVYILLFYIFSANPAKVRWRPVIWGLALQFIFALVILRTRWGFELFKWLGDRISEFLSNSDYGAGFVFGADTYAHHFFAFKVLPVVVFFSTAISVLYYLGWMQAVIEKVAWVMQVCMGTTAAESLNAAGNIFIGQSEAPLLIRPMIKDMTKSELHAVMTGGFATIAGSVMAAYILFGVPANHLLSASVMSAPAALAMSKLFYPETQKSKTTTKDVAKMERPPDRNILEAASNGATMSISLVANIAVNLIAFMSLLNFVNRTLTWFGDRVGIMPPYYPHLTFQLICSYILWPFAFVMGVDVADCGQMGELIGMKTFINEFVAYEYLSKIIGNRVTLESYFAANYTMNETSWTFSDLHLTAWNKTLEGGFMSVRSETIATYALCGFSNFGSMGVMIGALGAMAPSRKTEMSEVVFRAMIAGNVACFMTACIAGLLYEPFD